MSATVVVTWAGVPIVAPHAPSSMSTTAGGQVPSVSFRNSSGATSSNGMLPPEDVPDDPHLLCLAERL